MNNVSLANILKVASTNDKQFEDVKISSDKKSFSDTFKAVKQQTKVDINEKANIKQDEKTVAEPALEKVAEKQVHKGQEDNGVEKSEKNPKEEIEFMDNDENSLNKIEASLEDLILLLQQFVSLLDEKAAFTNENNPLLTENTELNLYADTEKIGLGESILDLISKKINENSSETENSGTEILSLFGKQDVESMLNILKDKISMDKDGKEVNPELLTKLNDMLSLVTEEGKDENLDLNKLLLIINDLSKDKTIPKDSETGVNILNQLASIINNEYLADNKDEITKTKPQEQNSLTSRVDTLTTLKNLVDKLANTDVPNEEIKTKIQELKSLLSDDKNIDKLHIKGILSELIQAKEQAAVESSNNQGTQDFLSFMRSKAAQYKSQSEGIAAQNREGKILENLTKDSVDKTDNKISKLNMLMGSLSSSLRNLETVDTPNVLPTVNKATVVQDVIKSIKYMELNNMKELTVRMNPKNLGEMAIKIISSGGNLSATITVKDREVYNTINANLNDIKNALNSQNFKVNEVSVNIYNDQSNYFSQNFGESGFNGKQGNSNGQSSTATRNFIDEDTVEAEEDISSGNLNILA